MTERRFLFIAKNLGSGGAEKVLLETAALLVERGHQVLVVVLSHEVDHSIPANLTIRRLNVINAWSKSLHRMAWVQRWQAQQVQREINLFQPDVVISCNAEYISQYVQHANLYHWVHGVITGSKPRVVADLTAIYQQAQLICVAQAIQDDIAAHQIEPKKSVVIYNPFDVTKIRQLAQAAILDVPPPFLLHVGSFHPRKRHDRLLQAYQLSGVQIPLLLMGKGEQLPQIEAWVKELGLQNRVLLHPFESNPYPYIHAASALILSSDQEGLPTVLIEALICQTPVVSVNCPSGPAEILTADLSPFLVPMNDVSALAAAIKAVVDTPPKIHVSHYQPFAAETILPQFEALA